jgi:hypothetical protein
MFRSKRTSRSWGPTEQLLGYVCIALVLIAGTIQVAHSHAAGDFSHPECSLCATAHVVISPSATTALPAIPVVVTAVEVEPAPTAPPSLLIFSFFIRPPPVALSAS